MDERVDETMLTGVLAADGQAQILASPRPRAHGDLVVVRVDITPMCTEFRARGDGERHEELGHEAIGVVVDAGDSTTLRAGDRVVIMPGFACGRCDLCVRGEHIFCTRQRDVLHESGSAAGAGTYAQYLVKPDYLALRIPDDVSSDHAAAAICLLGPGFNALRTMGVGRGESLLVGGCGPVGLGAVIVARSRGARVIAIERSPYRRELARVLGAEVFDPTSADFAGALLRSAGGEGASAAFETRPTAQLAGFVERLGRLAIVTWGAALTFPSLVPLGLTVHGSWHWNHLRDAEEMWDTIRRSRPLIDAAVTHRFDLTELSTAMDVQQSGQCGKVLLYPHGSSRV